MDEQTYSLAGNLAVREWDELFVSHPIGGSTDFTTLAGFVTTLLGHLPRPGEEVTYLNLVMRIEKMKRHRIERVCVTLAHTPAAGEENGNAVLVVNHRAGSRRR